MTAGAFQDCLLNLSRILARCEAVGVDPLSVLVNEQRGAEIHLGAYHFAVAGLAPIAESTSDHMRSLGYREFECRADGVRIVWLEALDAAEAA